MVQRDNLEQSLYKLIHSAVASMLSFFFLSPLLSQLLVFLLLLHLFHFSSASSSSSFDSLVYVVVVDVLFFLKSFPIVYILQRFANIFVLVWILLFRLMCIVCASLLFFFRSLHFHLICCCCHFIQASV